MSDYALQLLNNEILPPRKPFASCGDWDSVETILKVSLPNEYKQFIHKYGSGKVCDFVSVMSPFVVNESWSLIPFCTATIESYQSYFDTGVLTEIPYSMFPKNGGLIPFGTTENSNCLNWLTVGDPEEWQIIVWEPDFLEFFDSGYTSLPSFLYDLVLQKCGLYRDSPPLDWFSPPHSFTPIDFDKSV